VPLLALGSVRWRKVWRDLLEHRVRSLLVVLSIAVGVMAVGTIAGANALLERNLATATPRPRRRRPACSPRSRSTRGSWTSWSGCRAWPRPRAAAATITVDGLPGEEIAGTVESVGTYGPASQGDIVFRVVVAPSGATPDGLRWNMTVTIEIEGVGAEG
jgi:hypothetical protein